MKNHKRRLYRIGTGAIILVSLIVLFIIRIDVYLKDRHTTEIIDYRQVYVPFKKNGEGRCLWSNAAMANPTAWRCFSETTNEYFDPCFETESKMVCDVDLEEGKTGFEFTLTTPVLTQPRENGKHHSSFWKIKLSNNSICRPLTSALLSTDKNRYILYVCDIPNTGIFVDGIHKKDTTYYAEYVTYNNENQASHSAKFVDLQITEVKNMEIVTGWR